MINERNFKRDYFMPYSSYNFINFNDKLLNFIKVNTLDIPTIIYSFNFVIHINYINFANTVN